MRQVTLHELKQLARDAYDDLWDGARMYDRDVKLYLHWTAGHYDTNFNDYHVCIDGDGRVYVSTDDLAEKKPATYMRNTGSVAIAMNCCFNSILGDEVDLGPEPPTEPQINAMAQVICVLADALDLTIDLNRVMTHAEAADNKDDIAPHEPYGPENGCERWDLYVVHEGDVPYSGGDTMRGNANWYRASGQLKDI